MLDYLIAGVIGFGLAVAAWFAFRRRFGAPAMTLTIRDSIERLKSVGELVVFKVVSRQIVAAESHSWGNFARQWLTALMSTKKMALIIEYGIDFKYNLRDPQFKVEEVGEGRFRLTMPPCAYQIHVRDLKFYDERNARILPWLLGDIGEAFGPGFGEEEKNKLLEEARRQAEASAQEMVRQMESEVQSSAKQTMQSLALSFGAQQATVEFIATAPRQEATTQREDLEPTRQPAGAKTG